MAEETKKSHEKKEETVKAYLERYYIYDVIENQETFGRYKREAKRRFPEWLDYMESVKAMRATFTDEEIKALATSKREPRSIVKRIRFEGDKFVFAHITDTHMGSTTFHEDIWEAIVKEINNRNVDAVFHTGDVTEGLSLKRMDAVYDLTHVGYERQKAYAVEKLSMIKPPVYAVSGNHDRYYLKSAGALIVEDIARELENFHYMGEDIGDFVIENGDRPITIRLWHGEDGSSYAVSYRVQKIVESLTGGDKPNVLLLGHTHKQLYIFDRHIHCLSGGAVCTQSNWMRSKRLANHTGFHIVEMEFNERGVTKFTPTWYPMYE